MKAGLLSTPTAGRIIAALAVAVTLVVCGAIAAQSGTAPSQASGLAPTSAHCRAAALVAIVDVSAARHTADGTEVPIDFYNKSPEECVLRGYTPVTGVAAAGGHNARAVYLAGYKTQVFLPENYTAHTWVLIAKAAGAGCRRLTATGLRVGLTAGHLTISYPFTACAGPRQALLSIRPVVGGLASRTSFP
jgi:hypothetical protein